MSGRDLRASILDQLLPMPLYDIHSHLEGDAPAALGLHDILLYHMVVSDLRCAGCPDAGRIGDRRGTDQVRERLSRALPFVNRIRNTSCSWAIRIILGDLYNWREPLTPDNWRRLDSRINEQSQDPAWHRHVLDRTGAQRLTTELARRGSGTLDSLCDYSLEWAFFARTQQGVNDAPLYELERTWELDAPGAPLEFTQRTLRQEPRRPIRTVDDALSAIEHYVDCIPFDQVVSTAQHFSTDITYRPVRDRQMTQALAHRADATELDRDTYASFILDRFLTALGRRRERIAFILSMGAEALPYETASRFRQESVAEFADLVASHPRVHFIAMNASRHAEQSLCTLSRELPNLTLAGYWWHNFFPESIRQVLSTRLDMLPAGNLVGFFSDAYCVEWLYAKAVMVKTVMADVLAERVERGQYTVDDAVSVAAEILLGTPVRLLRH